MFPFRKKIVKEKGQEPTEIEDQVAQALHDLEANSQTSELKTDLADLTITSAKEVDVAGGKKAVIVFVPFRQHKQYHKIQQRLIRELEKKLNKHVTIVAQRKILRQPGKNNHTKQQKRPYSRSLTAVHDAILEDLVYPTEIVGKRTRVRLDGSRLIKVLLDRKDQTTQEYKLETFAGVYKKLTGKSAVFEFPIPVREIS